LSKIGLFLYHWSNILAVCLPEATNDYAASARIIPVLSITSLLEPCNFVAHCPVALTSFMQSFIKVSLKLTKRKQGSKKPGLFKKTKPGGFLGFIGFFAGFLKFQ